MTLAPWLGLFIWGGLLGGLYTVTLWRTVRRLPVSSRPVLLTVGSYYLRLATLALGLFVVMSGSFWRLAVTFAGFLLVRLLLVRRLGMPGQATSLPKGSRAWK